MAPTVGAFGLAVVLTVAMFVLMVRAVEAQRDAADQARRSERAVFVSSRLQRLTIDMETSIRGRLLAREEHFRRPTARPSPRYRAA
jgi:CHASE3 domain sensor protein